jgi:hypothetical protein
LILSPGKIRIYASPALAAILEADGKFYKTFVSPISGALRRQVVPLFKLFATMKEF